MPVPLKAPFPWFGGKRAVASLIWSRLGNVDNYVEPFAGSCAVLLLRPHPPRIETLNDADHYVSNFWRATQQDPEAVVSYADGPVSEVDLHSRHRWLVLSDHAKEFRERMRTDPDYFDVKVAGFWVWGICCWIGGGWCATPDTGPTHGPVGGSDERPPRLSKRNGIAAAGPCGEQRRPVIANPGTEHGHGVHGAADVQEKRPAISGKQKDNEGPYYGQGIHAKGPTEPSAGGRPQLADAYSLGRGVHAGPSEKRPFICHDYGMGVHGQSDGDPFGHNASAHVAGFPGGTCEQRRLWLLDWFGRLRDRLRNVRVCCGDWTRVCSSESVTTRLGLTGVYLDPPYGTLAKRAKGLYAQDSMTVAEQVRHWCLERGPDPQLRIALSGYAGEGHEVLEQHGWNSVAWEAGGGYGNRTEKGKANAKKERIWFSPACVREPTLFDHLDREAEHEKP